jgi:hypothetical protein
VPDFSVDVSGVAQTRGAFEEAATIGDGTAKYVVGTHVEYALYLEFGSSRMPAYPFMKPAIEDVMAGADRLADQASDVDHLVKLIAMEIEAQAKHYASTGLPPGPDVQTGNLRSSIRAERVS